MLAVTDGWCWILCGCLCRCVLDTTRLVDLLLVLLFEGRKALPKSGAMPVGGPSGHTAGLRRLDSAGERSHRQLIDCIRSKDTDALIDAIDNGSECFNAFTTQQSERKHVFRLSIRHFRPFVRSSGPIFLPRYLMNGLSSLDETYNEYSLACTDDLMGFWNPEVKGRGPSRPSRSNFVNTISPNGLSSVET